MKEKIRVVKHHYYNAEKKAQCIKYIVQVQTKCETVLPMCVDDDIICLEENELWQPMFTENGRVCEFDDMETAIKCAEGIFCPPDEVVWESDTQAN